MVLAPPPQISISLAPPEEPLVEPYSPFKWNFVDDEDLASFRPKHLTPPPTHLHFKQSQLSPLRPADTVKHSQGLERERFEALLKASRERNASAKKASDLRREIALKVHKTKQVERRNLFLSKIHEPPSPGAANLAKTPPESPCVFHYTLPSPGMVSPLALFESLNNKDGQDNPCQPWVEQVDFRLPAEKSDKQRPWPSTRKTALPSLEEISARLNSHDHSTTLPLIIKPRPANDRPRLAVGVGRLQIPAKASRRRPEELPMLPPKSPLSPKLQITTTVVPRSASLSPTELNETNLLALDSRQRRARDMLSTLRRRTVPSDLGLNGRDNDTFSEVTEDRKYRRQSAPADLDLLHRPRAGFEHPVLSLPGGF